MRKLLLFALVACGCSSGPSDSNYTAEIICPVNREVVVYDTVQLSSYHHNDTRLSIYNEVSGPLIRSFPPTCIVRTIP